MSELIKLVSLPDYTPKQRIQIIKDLFKNLNETDKQELALYLFNVYDKNIDYRIRLTTKEKRKLLQSISIHNNTVDLEKVNTFLYLTTLFKSKKEFMEHVVYRSSLNRPIVILYSDRRHEFTFTRQEWQLILYALDRNIGIGYEQIVKNFKNEIIDNLPIDTKLMIPIILPYFPFSLAEKPERINKIDDHEFIIQPKLDGIRAVIDTYSQYIYTRNHEYNLISDRPYLEKVYLQLKQLHKELENRNLTKKNEILFDGELFYSDFNTTQSLVSTEKEYEPDRDKLQFYIFDYVIAEKFINFDFTDSVINPIPQKERINFLLNEVSQIIQELKLDRLKIVPSFIVNRNQIIDKTMDFIQQGYEGSIVRRLNEPYTQGKDNNWIKVKMVNETEAIIIDILEGEGRLSNTTGSLLLQLPNGKQFKCSGMADEQRKEFWNNKDSYIGKVVDVIYQELTPDGIPRFPRLKGIRIDKDIHNINTTIPHNKEEFKVAIPKDFDINEML